MFEAPRQKKSWWGRNWFWVTPLGCLGLCSLPVVLFAGLFGMIFGTLKTSTAYADGLEIARTHPEVIRALGEPIEPGWLMGGQVSMTPSTGDMDVSVPLEGSRAGGTLYIVARRSAGEWRFERLEVEVDGRGDRIDLLAGERAEPPPEPQ